MKRIVRFSTIAVIALAGVMLACSRQNPEYIGPAYIAAQEGFNTSSLTPNKTTVNFTSLGANVKFNATFSSSVSWKLTITGQTSGAVHVIEDISDNLSNVMWTGAMDGAQFFKAGEVAKATLSFFGSSLTTTANVTITGVPNYSLCGRYAPGANFETPSGTTPETGWNGYNKAPDPNKPGGNSSTFITTIINVKQGVATSVGSGDNALRSDRNGNLVVAPQGNGYYYVIGKGDQQVFVSGLGFGSYTTATNGGKLYGVLPSDASQVWVNVYLYGSGDPNATVDLEFQESVDGIKDPNPASDDIFVAHVDLTHTGWKLFSFKYSDLVPSINDNGKNGNKIHEPKKLWGFGTVLLKKTDPNSPVELFMDFPIITVGGPFKPCF